MQLVIPRFRVGWMALSPEVLFTFLESEEDPKTLVSRHIAGDWGEVGPEEWARNEYAVTHGERVESRYRTRQGRTLTLITEGNRYATTILVSEELERKERP